MRRKYFRSARPTSGQILLGPDQAQQAGMPVVVDVGFLERDFQQFVLANASAISARRNAS